MTLKHSHLDQWTHNASEGPLKLRVISRFLFFKIVHDS